MTDRLAQPNDTALLLSRDHKRYLIRLLIDGELHTERAQHLPSKVNASCRKRACGCWSE